jgi:hypothetical protein
MIQPRVVQTIFTFGLLVLDHLIRFNVDVFDIFVARCTKYGDVIEILSFANRTIGASFYPCAETL